VVRPKVTPGGARFTRAGHGWACVPYRRATAALRQSAWVGSAAGAMHVCYPYTYTNIPTEGQAIPRHALVGSCVGSCWFLLVLVGSCWFLLVLVGLGFAGHEKEGTRQGSPSF
jgi:hypothetical protein